MITPATPINETIRLDTLRSLKLLDTAPVERFDRLTRVTQRLFGVSTALISLVDVDRQWVLSHQGPVADEIPRQVSFCGHTVLGDDVLVVPDALLDERFHDNPLVTGEPGIRFYAGCPLTLPNGSKVGTLSLFDALPRTLDESELGLLRDLTRIAEQEIAAEQMATRDELTRLSNRRGFMSLGQSSLSLCARLERPTWLHYFDLDDFKQINDNLGFAEGDRALAAFAKLLVKTFRNTDVVGRLGGDEFVVLVTNCSEEASQAAVKRLQKAVDKHNASSGLDYTLKFSVGAVQYQPLRHTSLDSMLADADTLMQARKRQQKAA